MEYKTTGEKRFGLGELPSDAVNYVSGTERRVKAGNAVATWTLDEDAVAPKKVVEGK